MNNLDIYMQEKFILIIYNLKIININIFIVNYTILFYTYVSATNSFAKENENHSRKLRLEKLLQDVYFDTWPVFRSVSLP